VDGLFFSISFSTYICDGRSKRATAGKRERVSQPLRWHWWWVAVIGAARLKVEEAVPMPA